MASSTSPSRDGGTYNHSDDTNNNNHDESNSSAYNTTNYEAPHQQKHNRKNDDAHPADSSDSSTTALGLLEKFAALNRSIDEVRQQRQNIRRQIDNVRVEIETTEEAIARQQQQRAGTSDIDGDNTTTTDASIWKSRLQSAQQDLRQADAAYNAIVRRRQAAHTEWEQAKRALPDALISLVEYSRQFRRQALEWKHRAVNYDNNNNCTATIDHDNHASSSLAYAPLRAYYVAHDQEHEGVPPWLAKRNSPKTSSSEPSRRSSMQSPTLVAERVHKPVTPVPNSPVDERDNNEHDQEPVAEPSSPDSEVELSHPDLWTIPETDTELVKAYDRYRSQLQTRDAQRANLEQTVRQPRRALQKSQTDRRNRIRQLEQQYERLQGECHSVAAQIQQHQKSLQQAKTKEATVRNRIRQQEASQLAKKSIVNPYGTKCNNNNQRLDPKEPKDVPMDSATTLPGSNNSKKKNRSSIDWFDDSDEEQDSQGAGQGPVAADETILATRSTDDAAKETTSNPATTTRTPTAGGLWLSSEDEDEDEVDLLMLSSYTPLGKRPKTG